MQKNVIITGVSRKCGIGAPIAIIVLYDFGNISHKISGRDGVVYDYDFLSSFQDEEIKYSKRVADYLRVPCLRFNANDNITVIMDFIDKR